MVDFLFVIIELLHCLLRLRCYKQKSVKVEIFEEVGHFESKFQTEGASPTNHCWCQNSRVTDLSCDIKISAVRHLVCHNQCAWRVNSQNNYQCRVKAPQHPQLRVGHWPCKGLWVDTKILKKI